MRKKIGIVGWKVGANSFGVTTSYLEYFNLFGNIKILSPVEPKEIDLDIDLLVLPGGPDISPITYGQVPDFSVGNSCPFKDYFEQAMLPIYVEKNIPVFGIN